VGAEVIHKAEKKGEGGPQKDQEKDQTKTRRGEIFQYPLWQCRNAKMRPIISPLTLRGDGKNPRWENGGESIRGWGSTLWPSPTKTQEGGERTGK